MRGQSIGAHTQTVHLLGKDRIARLDPKVPDGLFKLDKLSEDALIGKASKAVTFPHNFIVYFVAIYLQNLNHFIVRKRR